MGPSPLDIWSGQETVSLIREVRRRNRSLMARLLICRKIPRTRLGREAREALHTYKIPVFDAEISQRIAYVEAMLAGFPVVDFAPGSQAGEEIESLCEELIQ
jgi:chromosome partitioning protein